MTVVIGPDDEGPGTTWLIVEGGEDLYLAGGSPRGPRDRTVDSWLAYAKRHLRVPEGYTWVGADVRPYGYSQGAGHCPQGIHITLERR